MKFLYKYPQRRYPYEQLVTESQSRGRDLPEYEIMDSDAFDDDRYWDVFVEYAKDEDDPDSIYIRITSYNRGPDPPLCMLSLNCDPPLLPSLTSPVGPHDNCEIDPDIDAVEPDLIFTENNTNYSRNEVSGSLYFPRRTREWRMCRRAVEVDTFVGEEGPSIEDEGLFDDAIEERRQEADEFYNSLVFGTITDDLKQIMRQALGGMLWTKQYYTFIQKEWIEGDPAQPPPPPERKWEYPFFAAWDTAFHCIPLAVVDPAFAKKQLDLLTREWYMKPDGQIPAYEWNFSDVNPPVHAWATFRVFKIERKLTGKEDLAFLERVFQKLLLNFTWWVNRKDQGGNNVFEGGFLGLDNIGVFNRSEPLPTGGFLRQADGTSWMAFYCLNM
ncbi:glycoside hydrolase family protein [Salix suchowensis]|nr:glycoside hydrolase family protein [Salix suchowensis]